MRPVRTTPSRTWSRGSPASRVYAVSASDRADARGWRTVVPSEPRPHGRGHEGACAGASHGCASPVVAVHVGCLGEFQHSLSFPVRILPMEHPRHAKPGPRRWGPRAAVRLDRDRPRPRDGLEPDAFRCAGGSPGSLHAGGSGRLPGARLGPPGAEALEPRGGPAGGAVPEPPRLRRPGRAVLPPRRARCRSATCRSAPTAWCAAPIPSGRSPSSRRSSIDLPAT